MTDAIAQVTVLRNISLVQWLIKKKLQPAAKILNTKQYVETEMGKFVLACTTKKLPTFNHQDIFEHQLTLNYFIWIIKLKFIGCFGFVATCQLKVLSYATFLFAD